MKLYSAKIPVVAEEMVRTLAEAGDIEVSDPKEAALDVEAIHRHIRREVVRLLTTKGWTITNDVG